MTSHTVNYAGLIYARFNDSTGEIYVSFYNDCDWRDFKTVVPKNKEQENLLKAITPKVYELIDGATKSFRTLKKFLTEKERQHYETWHEIVIDSKLINGAAYKIQPDNPSGIMIFNKQRPTKKEWLCYHVDYTYEEQVPLGDILLALVMKVKAHELSLLKEKRISAAVEKRLFPERKRWKWLSANAAQNEKLDVFLDELEQATAQINEQYIRAGKIKDEIYKLTGSPYTEFYNADQNWEKRELRHNNYPFESRQLTRERMGTPLIEFRTVGSNDRYVMLAAGDVIFPGGVVSASDRAGVVVPYTGTQQPFGIYMGHETVAQGDIITVKLLS